MVVEEETSTLEAEEEEGTEEFFWQEQWYQAYLSNLWEAGSHCTFLFA